MPAALRFPVSAPMGQFQQDMEKAKSLTGQATQQIIKQFAMANRAILLQLGGIGAAAAGAAKGISGLAPGIQAAAAAARTLSSAILPVAAPLLVVYAAWKAVSAITEFAKEKAEEYIKIAKQAGEAGVSAGFFQRQSEAAKQFGIDIDDVQSALKKLKEGTTETLGGASFTKRLDELKEAGNFKGNAGVDAFAIANTTEERYRAIVQLITEAANKGERLAALDLAEKFLPAKMLDRLRANSAALSEMQAKADAVAQTKIVSDADIGRALDLKRRLDDAYDVLGNKFQPIQKDLISLGLRYEETWIRLVQNFASLVEYAARLQGILMTFPALGEAVRMALSKLPMTAWISTLLPDAAPAGPRPTGNAAKDAATSVLAAGLKNPDAIRNAEAQSTSIVERVRGDKSKQPKTEEAKAATETKDAFDRAVESANRHAAQMLADAAAVGLNKSAQEQLRAELGLLEAARRSGVEVSDEQIASYTRLRASMSAEQALKQSGITLTEAQAESYLKVSKRIGDVAAALEKVKDRAPLAEFARDAQNLDKQLTQLSLSGLRSIEDGFADVLTGTKSVSEAFTSMANSIIRDLIKIAVRQSITGPIAGALFGATGGNTTGAGGFGGLLAGLFGKGATTGGVGGLYAEGGTIPAHGVGIFAEHSPRGPQIVRAGNQPLMVSPREVVGRGSSSSSQPAGPMINIHVAGEVSQASVDRVHRMAVQTAQQLNRLGSSVRSAQYGQMTGVSYGG